MSSITVQYQAKRKVFKIHSPSTNLQMMLKEIGSHFNIDPLQYVLMHKNSVADTSVPFRLSGLSNNVVLDLVGKADINSRLPVSKRGSAAGNGQPQKCRLAMSIDGGPSVTATFDSTATLAAVVEHCAREGKISNALVGCGVFEINILGQVYAPETQGGTTLFDVGLAGQSSRVHIRSLTPVAPAPAPVPAVSGPDVHSSPAHTDVISSPEHADVHSSPAHADVHSSPAHAAALRLTQAMECEDTTAPVPAPVPDMGAAELSFDFYRSLHSQTRFKQALERLCSAGFSGAVRPLLVLILKYLSNMINFYPPHPQSQKVSRIRCGNKSFQAFLGLPCAVEVLLCLGFVPSAPQGIHLGLTTAGGAAVEEVFSSSAQADAAAEAGWLGEVLSFAEFAALVGTDAIARGPSGPAAAAMTHGGRVRVLEEVSLLVYPEATVDMLELVMMRERLTMVAEKEFDVQPADYPALTTAPRGNINPGSAGGAGMVHSMAQMARESFGAPAAPEPTPAFDPYRAYSLRSGADAEARKLVDLVERHGQGHGQSSSSSTCSSSNPAPNPDSSDGLRPAHNTMACAGAGHGHSIEKKVADLEARRRELLAPQPVSPCTQLLLPTATTTTTTTTTAASIAADIEEDEEESEYAHTDKKLVMTHLIKKMKRSGGGAGGAEDGSDNPLRPRIFQEHDALQQARVYTRTLVRVRLPDSATLSAYFHPTDSLARVLQWLTGCVSARARAAVEVRSPQEAGAEGSEADTAMAQSKRFFSLRLPHLALAGAPTSAADAQHTQSLSELICVPSATVHCAWAPALAAFIAEDTQSQRQSQSQSQGQRMDVEGGNIEVNQPQAPVKVPEPASVHASVLVFGEQFLMPSDGEPNIPPTGVSLGGAGAGTDPASLAAATLLAAVEDKSKDKGQSQHAPNAKTVPGKTGAPKAMPKWFKG